MLDMPRQTEALRQSPSDVRELHAPEFVLRMASAKKADSGDYVRLQLEP
jgi:hypothetical protein